MSIKENFFSLSLQDLLEARDAYHNYLVRLENVAATAVGRKRFRREGVDRNEPIRMSNSEVRKGSWPCVLVFVTRWLGKSELAREKHLGHFIPEVLVLRDGRSIPTCVIELEPADAEPNTDYLDYQSDLIGGSYPVITHEQGRTHYGTLACLVSDGSATYGLTCRHVAGEPGRKIYSQIAGQEQEIGVSSKQQLGRRLFSNVYPGLVGEHTFVNIDAGLIHLKELDCCTALVHGIGRVGPIYDMGPQTVSLDLIGKPVRAFGAMSGPLFGEIAAIFYRYKEIAGVEYVADVMIGPRIDMPAALPTTRGDSGTLFFMDSPKKGEPLRPIAMQWGGTLQKQQRFVLATFLSTICRELNVDVVSSWNTGHFEYWGGRIHPLAAVSACKLLPEGKLRQLVENNVDTLGELALVPDKWKPGRGHLQEYQQARQAEKPLHYTDMDAAGHGPWAGKTLLDIWKDPKRITREIYAQYLGKEDSDVDTGADEPSTLPFRAAYVWSEMVRLARAGDAEKFLCAAGVLSHYTWDAACALHLSRYHDGYPKDERPDATAAERGVGIHANYDNLSRIKLKVSTVRDSLLEALDGVELDADALKGPRDVAWKVIELMRDVYKHLDPKKLVDHYIEKDGRLDWKYLEKPTIAALAHASRLTAEAWVAAWNAGDGDRHIKDRDLKARDFEQLAQTWQDPEFLPSDQSFDPGREAA